MSVKSEGPTKPQRQGVIAVCVRDGDLLVIQRSELVEAPRAYCFPGGAIESGEREDQTLIREMHEELNVRVVPVRQLWRSETAWGVALSWWLAHIPQGEKLCANPQEVAGFHWLSPDRIRELPGVLSSNLAFLDALAGGVFNLEGSDNWGDESSGRTSKG